MNDMKLIGLTAFFSAAFLTAIMEKAVAEWGWKWFAAIAVVSVVTVGALLHGITRQD